MHHPSLRRTIVVVAAALTLTLTWRSPAAGDLRNSPSVNTTSVNCRPLLFVDPVIRIRAGLPPY
ncbi:MAG: hypothetical protein M3Y35_13950 [Actinomycetota bacterium]|nr:hypothetical protein [Actinomycetota bacterium]